MADIANDSLSAVVHMHMLDPYVLFALAPFPRQGFDLEGVRPVTLVSVACDGAARTGDQFEQDNIRHSHMGCKHRLDLVFRPHAIDHGKGGVECKLIGTTGTKIVVQRMILGRLP
jgi:hypothetical protein